MRKTARGTQDLPDELVRCSGVGKTKRADFKQVMEEFQLITSFPSKRIPACRPHGLRVWPRPVRLIRARKLLEPSGLQVVLEAAVDAADLLVRSPPNKVAFLCRAGKNRSRLLCSLACLFAELKLQRQDSIDATTPVCADLRGLIQEISNVIDAAKAIDKSACAYQAAQAAVGKLTPFPPPASRRNSKRKM